MNIGEQLRIVREQKNYKQQYVAKMLGISLTAYGDIERGKTDLNWKRLIQICTVLGITIQELVNHTN